MTRYRKPHGSRRSNWPPKMEAGAAEQSTAVKALRDQANAALAEVRCVSGVTSGLPRSWDEVTAGHMVLMHESLDSGWWEATVIKRDGDVLTLRLRDYPERGTWIRHISTVARVNPGSLRAQHRPGPWLRATLSGRPLPSGNITPSWKLVRIGEVVQLIEAITSP